MTDVEELLDRLEAGDLRPYELEEAADTPVDAMAARRRHLADRTGAPLEAVGETALDPGVAAANIENMVGAAQVPLGVAGPVSVDGDAASGAYHLPLATTEGALVASVNRGCAVIEAAGGATARVFRAAMTRAPVFRVAGAAEAAAVVDWVDANATRLREAAEATTSHGELLGVDPYVVGDNVYLRFAFDTKDAMGMNMATMATRAAAELVETETPADLVALSGNLCTDKKPAAINAVEGRGYTVGADVVLPDAVVEDRLHVAPDALAEVNVRKNLLGSAKAGSYGFNAQVANVVAAMFLATGQDEAQVVEGANAITTVDRRADGLYVGVTLASLEVGTVGGGTRLPTQAEALELMGLAGGGDPPGANGRALAEVVAVGALAGELSLLGALGSRHLAEAHERLGR
ncbi:MAG: hydroxymethylglutaryl-CoA reductase (NADPH) [Halobacteriales archaeon]